MVFLGLSVLALRPMYATDRRQTDRRQTKASLNAPPIRGGGIINLKQYSQFLAHNIQIVLASKSFYSFSSNFTLSYYQFFRVSEKTFFHTSLLCFKHAVEYKTVL